MLLGTLGAGGGAGLPHLLDFVALAAGMAATALVKIPTWLERAKWQPAWLAWGLLVALSVVALQSPGVTRSLTAQAPVSFAPLSWLGGGS